LSALQKQLRSEFPYGTAKCRSCARRRFLTRTNGAKRGPNLKNSFRCCTSRKSVRQRAQLRIAQCRVQLKSPVSLISSLSPTDPDVDADRLYALSQFERTAKNESAMLSAIEQIVQKYPQSHWADDALMAAGTTTGEPGSQQSRAILPARSRHLSQQQK